MLSLLAVVCMEGELAPRHKERHVRRPSQDVDTYAFDWILCHLLLCRRLHQDGPSASLPGPSAPPSVPAARPSVEHLEPGPSTQAATPTEAGPSEPREAEERPGPSTGQGIPGQEEMPELPDEEPGAAENGEAREEEEVKAEERKRYGEEDVCERAGSMQFLGYFGNMPRPMLEALTWRELGLSGESRNR